MSPYSILIFNLLLLTQNIQSISNRNKIFNMETFDVEIEKILYYQGNRSEITVPTELFIELVHRSRLPKHLKFKGEKGFGLLSIGVFMFLFGIIISSIITLIYCLCRKYLNEKRNLLDNIMLSEQIEMSGVTQFQNYKTSL